MDSEGNTAMHIAAANGLETEILYQAGISDVINAVNIYGWTPLMYGAHYGHVKVVTKLLSLGADVSMKNKYGCSAITLAAASGHVGVVREILRTYPSDMSESEFVSPLAVAALNGNVSMMRFLIDNGCDINSGIPVSGVTSLMLAVFENHLEVVKLLIDRGANINCKNFAGHTALDLAILRGHLNIASLLTKKFENKSDLIIVSPYIKNKEAVAHAAKTGNLLSLRKLLSQNPSLSTTAQWLGSGTETSSEMHNNGDVIQMPSLNMNLQKNLEVSEKRKGFFSSPVHFPFHNEEVVLNKSENIGFGFNSLIKAKDDYGKGMTDNSVKNDPLLGSINVEFHNRCSESKISDLSMHNFEKANESYIKKESENGGNYTECDFKEICFNSELLQEDILEYSSKNSPLALACSNGHTEVARFLIAAGSDPNREREGRTPLMLAAIRSNVELAKLLLSAGADPLALSSKDNLTAFDLATLYGSDTEFIRVIARHTFPPIVNDIGSNCSTSNLNISDCFGSPNAFLKKISLYKTPKSARNLSPNYSNQNLYSKSEKVPKYKRCKWLKYSKELFPSLTWNFTSQNGKEKVGSLRNNFDNMYSILDNSYLKMFNFSLDTPFRPLISDKISEIITPTIFCCNKLKSEWKGKPITTNIKTCSIKCTLNNNQYEPKDANEFSSDYNEVEHATKSHVLPLKILSNPKITTNRNKTKTLSAYNYQSSNTLQRLKAEKNANVMDIKLIDEKTLEKKGNGQEEFTEFLKKSNLDKYRKIFQENEAEDIDIILSLNEIDLEEMGINCADERGKCIKKENNRRIHDFCSVLNVPSKTIPSCTNFVWALYGSLLMP